MKALLIAALLSLPVFAADGTPVVAAKSPCGPEDVKFKVKAGPKGQPIGQPEPGNALVYVVEEFDRPSNEWGRPTIRLSVDGLWAGANRGSSYLSFSVGPGEHHLCSDWQSLPPWLRVQPSAAHLTAEAGQTYFFRSRVVEHRGYFTLDLEEVDSDKGQLLVSNSPASEYRTR